MSVTAFIAIFFLIWWIVFFAVLPWGVRSQHEAQSYEPGTDPGAPQRPLLLIKLAATTVIACVVMAAAYAVWESGILPLDRLPAPYTPTR